MPPFASDSYADDSAVEGSEEHFDESEHVDGVVAEERSTNGEDGSDEEVRERAEVSAQENAQVEVRDEITLVWRTLGWRRR